MMPGLYNLADNLVGYTIGDWTVVKKLTHKSSTGGNFSIGYEVINSSGSKGFLKALDYSSAFSGPNMVDKLNAMTGAYIFERDLLSKCIDKRLRYVVKIIDGGHFELGPDQYPVGVAFCPPVDYMILEMADYSIRNLIDVSHAFDYAWALRSLHNVAVGIEEMHGVQIAHQDVKPSNVLIFDEKRVSKLGDVGRASSITTPAEHDQFVCAGDPKYSPFEQLYGEANPDWKMRRYSCDMFMFGNLIMTYFTNVSITMAVLNKLPLSCFPGDWKGTYRAILPQIQNVFSECMEEFNHNVDKELRNELVAMVQQLCCPEPEKRGDLKNAHLGSQQYSLRRYISRLDYWAKKYEYQFKKVIV